MDNCHEPVSARLGEHQVIDPYRRNGASVDVTVGTCQNHVLSSILGFDEAITESPSPKGSRACGRLLSVERFVKTNAQGAP
jgi:hypothetical protein